MQRRGYLTIVENGEVKKTEIDTITCGHCQFIILLHDKDGNVIPEPSGFCRCCMNVICLACNSVLLTAGCQVFEKRIERSERRQAHLRGLAKQLL